MLIAIDIDEPYGSLVFYSDRAVWRNLRFRERYGIEVPKEVVEAIDTLIECLNITAAAGWIERGEVREASGEEASRWKLFASRIWPTEEGCTFNPNIYLCEYDKLPSVGTMEYLYCLEHFGERFANWFHKRRKRRMTE